MANEYESALKKARSELTELEVQQKKLAQRKAQLLQTIAILAPLVSEQPVQESLKLADAIRNVIAAAANEHRHTVFNPQVVRSLLLESGFDFIGYSGNRLALIHSAMRRMRSMGELRPAGGDPEVLNDYKPTEGWLRSFVPRRSAFNGQ